MYFSRATQSNCHVNGVFPQIRIISPGTAEKVPCEGFAVTVEVKCARLRKNSYYYRVFVDGDVVGDKCYKEGDIEVKDVCIGPLKVSVRLYFCDDVVDEDNITLVAHGEKCPNEDGVCGGEGSCIPPSGIGSSSDSEDTDDEGECDSKEECVPPTDCSDEDSDEECVDECVPPTDCSDSSNSDDECIPDGHPSEECDSNEECVPPTDCSDSSDSDNDECDDDCIPPSETGSDTDSEDECDSKEECVPPTDCSDSEDECDSKEECVPPSDSESETDSEDEDEERSPFGRSSGDIKVVCKPGPKGDKGEKGDRGAPGDGGKAKEICESTCLSPNIRTYIVKPNKCEDIILTLPESKFNDCDEDGFVITIYNDSGELVLVQAPAGNTIKATGGAFLLGLNQSTTFHDSNEVWYPVSK